MQTTPHWPVVFHDDFDPEFDAFDEAAQDALLAAAKAVMLAGPRCGRPTVDTLKGSRYANMKELRYTAAGGSQVWRAAFAFDTVRRAIILCAAAKQGTNSKLFYRRLVDKADSRFERHEQQLQQARKRS